MDINIRAFGGEATCFCYNFDPSADQLPPGPGAPPARSLLGGHATPVDPDLKGQYIDELHRRHRVRGRRATSASARSSCTANLGRVIEDFLVPVGRRVLHRQPGQGPRRRDGVLRLHAGRGAEGEARSATAFELSARKRFSDGWQFIASYVWQRLEGNYDGVFQNSTGQLDPNINSAFDYADFLVNADGTADQRPRRTRSSSTAATSSSKGR